jgi:hypothetical protein
MLELTEQQIKEIADLLDSGLVCYYNKITHEIKEILDFENNEYTDTEVWQELINEIEEHSDQYFKFERMSSQESFGIMAEFIDEVENEELKNRLAWALNRNHPFRNFKDEIDYNGEYRERWVKFKAGKYFEHVENQILEYNQLEGIRENEEEQEELEDLGK